MLVPQCIIFDFNNVLVNVQININLDFFLMLQKYCSLLVHVN